MNIDRIRGANIKNIFTNSIDIKALHNFNDAIKSGLNYNKAYELAIMRSNKATRQAAVNFIKSKVSLDDFIANLDRSTLSAKAGQIAMKGLSIAGNMLAGMAVGVAINLAVKAIDHYVNRVKYAREALADANAEYKNTVSEIENINTELDSLAEKMHALETGGITFAEQEEYDRLKDSTAELERQLAIKQTMAKLEAREAASKAVKSYKYDESDNLTHDMIGKLQTTRNADQMQTLTHSDGGNLSDTLEFQLAYYKKLQDTIAKKNNEIKRLNESGGKDAEKQIEKLDADITRYEGYLTENIADINERAVAAQEGYDALKTLEESGEVLTETQTKALNGYKEILDFISFYTGSESSAISVAFDQEQFNGVKEQLVKLGKDGKLSIGSLTKEFPELISYLDAAGVEAEDLWKYIMAIADPDALNRIDSISALKKKFAPNQITVYDDIKTAEWIDRLSDEDLKLMMTCDIDEDSSLEELQNWLYNAKRQFNFSADFDFLEGTDIGSRLSDIGSRFQEGTLSYKEYFKSLADEINNIDFSQYTDSVEDAKNASISFFLAGINATSTGLQNLIKGFNQNAMSVSEYLDGYTAIAESLSSLADLLQENSDAWMKEGESIDDVANNQLDGYQKSLSDTIAKLNELKDSNFSLSQILGVDENGFRALDPNTEEFKNHVNVISKDLARIVSEGGAMADEIKSRLGSTTEEIAKSMNESIANQEFAAKAIAANTNQEISDMAKSIGELFNSLSEALKKFDFSISIGVKSIKWSKTSFQLGDQEKLISLPEIEFGTKINSEGLNLFADAISGFGKQLQEKAESQKVSVDDYKSPPTVGYKHDKEEFKDKSNSAGRAGKEAADKYVEAFEKELKRLDSLKERGKINEKQYLDALRALYEKYFKGRKKYLDKFKEYESKYLQGMKSLYESAMSGIIGVIDDHISSLNEEKEAALDSLEAQRDAAIDALEAKKEQIEAEKELIQEKIDGIDKEIEAKQDQIDAINDEADAKKKAYDLDKAKYELDRLKNQRTIYEYSGKEKGFIYKTDDKAIRDQQMEVEDIEREIRIDKIEKEIDLLEKQKEVLQDQQEELEKQQAAIDKRIDAMNDYYDNLIANTESYWDNMIKGFEETKSRWEELQELQEKAELDTLLKSVTGKGIDEVLAMTEADFNAFKNMYLSNVAEINSGNQQMLDSLSKISGVDLSTLPGYLSETAEYINMLSTGIDFSNMDESLGGVIDSFGQMAESAGHATGAIIGGGFTASSTGTSKGEGSQSSGGQGAGSDLNSAVDTFEKEAVPKIKNVGNAFDGGEGDEDGESSGGLAGAVTTTRDTIGPGGESGKSGGKGESGEGSNLQDTLDIQTKAALDPETGIPAQTEAWNNLNEILKQVKDNLSEIKSTLENMPEVEVTGGSLKIFATGTDPGFKIGNAYAKGVDGLKHAEKNALRSEYGQPELTVYPNGKAELTTSPIMSDLPKGTVIYNEKQTMDILDGKAEATELGTPVAIGPAFQNMAADFQKAIKSDPAALLSGISSQMENITKDLQPIHVEQKNTSNSYVTTIGDIHLHEVQNVDTLGRAIATRLPTAVKQMMSIKR